MIDLTNERFGKLVVISEEPTRKNHRYWRCMCDCGNETIVQMSSLRNGRTRSCGCGMGITHGGSKTRLYNIWYGIIRRCEDETREEYRNYGARGIKMCEEWRSDFSAFRSWALSHGYDDDLSIDRINDDGDYCPENCRWASKLMQENNKRKTIRLTVGGITKSISDWSRDTGIPYSVLKDRYYSGWDSTRIVGTAVGG